MICVRKILALFIIFMMLVPFVCAGDTKHVGDEKVVSEKPTTEKVTDKTKEKTTEITSKDKSITGKITVTDTDISKYKVEKKSSTEISISKQEAKGEHTKAKVSISKSELQKIDIDKDGKFGILHISDTGEVTHTTATEAELVAGKVMTFSTNIVNGYSGYKQYTFSDVESGDTLNIEDVSGNYTITAAVDGVVPTYTAGIPTSGLIGYWPLKQNASDMSGNGRHGTAYSISYANGSAFFNGHSSYVSVGILPNITTSGTIFATITPFGSWSTMATPTAIIQSSAEGFGLESSSGGNVNVYFRHRNSTNTYFTSSSASPPTRTFLYATRNSTYQTLWYDTTRKDIDAVKGTVKNFSTAHQIGKLGTNAYYFRGFIQDVGIYNRYLNTSERRQVYAGGSGISFQPEPSYNFTGYNVASGVEKVIDTDSTCTGLEYVDTTGGTHDVVVTVYFTEDTTLISDSHTALVQTVNITHTSTNTADNGSIIPYEILDGYDGTAVLSSNNTNASISRNETAFVISTGYLAAGSTYYYNVQIPNPVEEMLWSDWDPTNETCNAKVQIGNSTPYTTWNITTYNVTAGNVYSLYNPLTLTNAFYRLGTTQASLICTNLSDQEYWIQEQEYLPGTMINITYRKTSGGWEPTSTTFGSSVPISSYTQVTVS